MTDKYIGLVEIGKRLGCGRAAVARLHRVEGLPLVKLPLRRAQAHRARRSWVLYESVLNTWLVSKAIEDRQVLLRRREERSRQRDYPSASGGVEGSRPLSKPLARENGDEPPPGEAAS